MLERVWRKVNILTPLVGMQANRGTMENSVEISLKTGNRTAKIAHISHASKVLLKILQARLQQYVNHELPDVQAGFRQPEEPEIKLPTLAGSLKKQESSRKTSVSALLTMPKPLTV